MDTLDTLVDVVNRTPPQDHAVLRTLIDHLPDAVYIKDTRSSFILGNVTVAQIMGARTPDELVSKTDFDFYPPGGSAEVLWRRASIDPVGQAID